MGRSTKWPGNVRYLLTLAVVVLAACFVDQLTSTGPDANDIQLTITGDSVVVLAGREPLAATVNGLAPSGAALIRWSSSSDANATVDSTTGLVRGVTKGTVTITARLLAPELDTAITATHQMRIAYAAIAIDSIPELHGIGQKRPVTSWGQDSTFSNVALVAPTYGVTSAGVLTVGPGDTVVALANGTTNVTAAFEGLTAQRGVAVRQVAKTVTFAQDTLLVGALQRDYTVPTLVSLAVLDSMNVAMASPTFTWTASTPASLTVTGAGVIRALVVDTSALVARVDSARDTLTVGVKQILAGLSINAGDGQTDTVGQALAVAPATLAHDSGGGAMAGVGVAFSLPGAGNGAITGAGPTTNGSGVATLGSWTLDTIAGRDTVIASAGAVPCSIRGSCCVKATARNGVAASVRRACM